MHLPILESERLILRRLELTDAPVIRELAGAREIAATTLNIPHPYGEGVAETFITMTHKNQAEGQHTFGIVRKSDSTLMGCIGLRAKNGSHAAEMGYWVGVPYWGYGYATEAARRVIRFGFDELGLHRIYANYFTDNPASRRVMEKAGMTYEGTMRQHVLKWNEYKDLGYCAILKSEVVE